MIEWSEATLSTMAKLIQTFLPNPGSERYGLVASVSRNHLRLGAKEEPLRLQATVLCRLTRLYFAATIVS